MARLAVRLAAIPIMLVVMTHPAAAQVPPGPDEWTAYGRDAAGTRYSPLEEIDRSNVARLELAWIYRTGDLMLDRGRFQSTPLVVDGRLYVSSPLGRVSAVDPVDGRELWTFDPRVDLHGSYGDFANRGVSYWRASRPARFAWVRRATGRPACDARIFIATIDARLIALDAGTGERCTGFGSRGEVDLKTGLRNPPSHLGEYQVTSPPAVIGDRIVVGSAIADNQRRDAPSGVIRAFHARTGRLLWAWDPVPQDPADPARDTWVGPHAHDTGAANAWAPLSADAELGLVFVPTSSPSPDFYGGERLGRNDYANSLVALDAESGRVRWHFQVVHHDLWDYDIPAQPVLFPFRRDGRETPAVVLATKMGHLFVLDRRTGEPIHPVEERPVPASTVPGEQAWPTQPFPVRPAPLAPQRLDPEDRLGATGDDDRWCRERLAGLRNHGIFTPPSLEGTVIIPGNVGGMHWGGVAVDPVRGIGVVPTNRLPFVVTLVPRAELEAGRRPGAELSPQRGTPYAMRREVLVAPSGAPCAPPPWGALSAVDLISGEHLWEVPLGAAVPQDRAALRTAETHAASGPGGGRPGAAPTAMVAGADAAAGMPNMGGALVTAGGLAFMAGTPDRSLRAFDLETGRVLWRGDLPTDALATPMTYRAGGRQYVVVAAGGHDRMRALTGAPLGDYLVAFALPDSAPGRRPRRGGAADATGSWTGEVRAGRDRFRATLVIRARDGLMAGALSVTGGEFQADLAVRASGSGFHLEGRFRMADGCAGTAALDADLANLATLLVGRFRLQGPCFDGEDAVGTFSLRRQA